MAGTWAVLERELRSMARHGSTFELRVLSGACVLALLSYYLLENTGFPYDLGAVAFSYLQATLYSTIWILVPIMTCDCISRERREGTLGLLFLTPLKPLTVAVAKAFSSSFNGFAVALAALPMLMLPLLLGGVTGLDIVRAVLMDAMALLGGTAAGLLASSVCRQHLRALSLALGLATLLALGLGDIISAYFLLTWPRAYEVDAWRWLTLGAWFFPANADRVWLQREFATKPEVLLVSAGQVAVAGLILVLTLVLVSRRIRKLVGEPLLHPRHSWWWLNFCVPRFFQSWFRRRMTRKLERNPVGWLQVRTWSARLTQFGIILGAGCCEAMVVPSVGSSDLAETQMALIGALLALLCLSSAASFRTERESGIFEMLLVTPLSARQIITGRLWAIHGQFLPALLLIETTWYLAVTWFERPDRLKEFLVWAGLVGCLWLCVPVIGLYQSLARRHFFPAWMSTLLLGLGLPSVGVMLFFETLSYVVYELGLAHRGSFWAGKHLVYLVMATSVGVLVSVTAWSAGRLHRHLAHRSFLKP